VTLAVAARAGVVPVSRRGVLAVAALLTALALLGGQALALGAEARARPPGWDRRRALAVRAYSVADWLLLPLVLLAGLALVPQASPTADAAVYLVALAASVLGEAPLRRLLGRHAPAPEELREAVARRVPGETLHLDLLCTRRAGFLNAFAWFPSRRRRVTVTDELLEQLGAEDAAVIVCHELGHLVHRHVEKRLGAWAGVQLLGLGALLAAGLVGPASLLALWVVATFGVLAPISRRHELEADRFAAARCGAAACESALRRLHAASLLPSDTPHFVSHPGLRERTAGVGEGPPR